MLQIGRQLWRPTISKHLEAHTGTAGKGHGRRKKKIRGDSLQYANGSHEVEGEDDEAAWTEDEERKSKGQSKREALRSREWGVQLASLSPSQLRHAIRWASLSDEVYDAVMLVKGLGLKVRNGKRRQFSYIGGLLRAADPRLMEQAIKAAKDGDPPGLPFESALVPGQGEQGVFDDEETSSVSQEGTLAQTTAARWLEGLLVGDAAATIEVFSHHGDNFNRQELRRLIRDAQQTGDKVAPSLDQSHSVNGEAAPPSSPPDVASVKQYKKVQLELFEFLVELARRRSHAIMHLEV